MSQPLRFGDIDPERIAEASDRQLEGALNLLASERRMTEVQRTVLDELLRRNDITAERIAEAAPERLWQTLNLLHWALKSVVASTTGASRYRVSEAQRAVLEALWWDREDSVATDLKEVAEFLRNRPEITDPMRVAATQALEALVQHIAGSSGTDDV
jgi:hypothetical protein